MIEADGAHWWQRAGNRLTDTMVHCQVVERRADQDSELKFHLLSRIVLTTSVDAARDEMNMWTTVLAVSTNTDRTT